MFLDSDRRILTGHVANANPHPERQGDGTALVIFQGLDAYVSPNWYPSKVLHGKAVPTWNYEVVHVTGALTWRRDANWLLDYLIKLTDRFEQSQVNPWKVTDAPKYYIDRLINNLVGIEISVRDVQVKRKLSQNRSVKDWQGVVAGLLASDEPGDRVLGVAMSQQPHIPGPSDN